jgi:tetratricopeptide (TPR) repeat protein
MLLTDLAQIPGLDVVSSHYLHEILDQLGQDNVEIVDKSLVSEIARRTGAGAVVEGTIFSSGREIRIDVQLVDIRTGRVLTAHSAKGSDVFPLVDELADRIRVSLQLSDTTPGRPISEITTASLEAYRLYSKGVDAYNGIRFEEAWKLFVEALEIDPSFAMAYFQLSEIALWSEWGRISRFPGPGGEVISSEEYLHRAVERIDRLPERQKLLVQAGVARRRGLREGHVDEAVALYEELIALYPDEEDAYFRLSSIYPRSARPDELLEILEKGVKTQPHLGPLRNTYGYILLNVGRYTEAIQEFDAYVQLGPVEVNPYSSLAEGYIISGQPEKALETLSHGFEVNPSFELHTESAWAYAMLGRYEEALAEAAKIGGWAPATKGHLLQAFMLSRLGRYQAAREHIHRASELTEVRENPPDGVYALLMSALLSLEQEKHSESIEYAVLAEEMIPRPPRIAISRMQMAYAHLLTGIAEARSGRLAAARAHRDALRDVFDIPSSFRRDQVRRCYIYAFDGEIALASGDLNGAEVAFISSTLELKMAALPALLPIGTALLNHPPFRDGLARVKKARGDLACAIAIYRHLNTPGMSNNWTAMLEPRYILEVARLLDELGDKDGARAEYRRFLELWKDADPELPELEEAKRYLAKSNE